MKQKCTPKSVILSNTDMAERERDREKQREREKKKEKEKERERESCLDVNIRTYILDIDCEMQRDNRLQHTATHCSIPPLHSLCCWCAMKN